MSQITCGYVSFFEHAEHLEMLYPIAIYVQTYNYYRFHIMGTFLLNTLGLTVRCYGQCQLCSIVSKWL